MESWCPGNDTNAAMQAVQRHHERELEMVRYKTNPAQNHRGLDDPAGAS